MLLLVHHADAVLPGVDPMQPLSARGRAQAELVAREAASRGAKPELIWHSGKLRARQTAEAIWRACNPFATLTAVRGLQPTDPPGWMHDTLTGEVRSIALVGHIPNLSRVLRLLLGEDTDQSPITFPLHGLVALEAAGDLWVERWRVDVPA
jgi:phosphohistidine phosphatase